MIDNHEYYTSEIVAKIRPNAVKMEVFRDNKTFNEMELVLGFSAYIYWLAGAVSLEVKKEQDEYLKTASESARQVALEFVGMLKANKYLTATIKKQIDFNPEEELEWGWTKEENPKWHGCLTRAIVLITRGLAYATLDYSDAIGPFESVETLEFLKFVELADLYQEAFIWASMVMGSKAAQMLLNIN